MGNSYWRCHTCGEFVHEERCSTCNNKPFRRPPLTWHIIMAFIYKRED